MEADASASCKMSQLNPDPYFSLAHGKMKDVSQKLEFLQFLYNHLYTAHGSRIPELNDMRTQRACSNLLSPPNFSCLDQAIAKLSAKTAKEAICIIHITREQTTKGSQILKITCPRLKLTLPLLWLCIALVFPEQPCCMACHLNTLLGLEFFPNTFVRHSTAGSHGWNSLSSAEYLFHKTDQCHVPIYQTYTGLPFWNCH